MDIRFENKLSPKGTIVLVCLNGKTIKDSKILSDPVKDLVKDFIKDNKKKSYKIDSIKLLHGNKFIDLVLAKLDDVKKSIDYINIEFGGKILSHLEKINPNEISVLIEGSDSYLKSTIEQITYGMKLKSYRFDKYKTKTKVSMNLKKITILNDAKIFSSSERKEIESMNAIKGIFLTRDLVSEPANVLYPQKFVEMCNQMKKVGVSIEVLDEKKIESIGMNALLGVAKGSSKPPRVMIMKWQGKKKSEFKKPLAFVGKGVTFDTGGISLKPSGGMEDMKWDMGGAAVVAGLLYTLALRKAKVDVIGIVGLVENMPDGEAQRPGDVVKSLSGQTIEVLNTDAEGRLVLADILWYLNQKYEPKFMIDLATLTGAIIVALGDRYAGLFSNSDKLSDMILDASKNTGELVWRLPLDEKFDKLLNCQIADMKNITGGRGAGSITAAQFLKRFVGKTEWAHLDIAGVTWSKGGTNLSRSGGTGFGVRLLDTLVKINYED